MRGYRVLVGALREVWPGLALGFAYWGLALFIPHFWLVVFVLFSILAYDAWGVWRGILVLDWWRPVKSVLVSSLVLGLVIMLARWLGAYGFWGVLGLLVFVSLVLLWRRWETYLWWLRYIEREFFGMTAEERRLLNKNKKWRRKNG